jgi:hypothetical protein
MKNSVFWVVTPCGSCRVLTRATRRNNPEETILQRKITSTHFCQRLSGPQGLVRQEGLGKLNGFRKLAIVNCIARKQLLVFECSVRRNWLELFYLS